jgi:hypothetical protein
MSDSEKLLAIIGVALPFVAIGLFVRWVRQAKSKPDPWDAEVEAKIQHPDAVPLCQRCLEPQPLNRWFCADCGAPVSPYCTWASYLDILSLGDALRSGVTGNFRVTKLAVVGYLAFSVSQYFILAPWYWFFFFRNLKRIRESDKAKELVAGAGE